MLGRFSFYPSFRLPMAAAPAAAAPYTQAYSNAMKGWATRTFGGQMQLETDLRIPEISHPNHVLVKVKAASVNPVDTIMPNGYGNTLLGMLKQAQDGSFLRPSRLPFIGGRDCSGVVVHKGRNVKNLQEGDEVMAVVGGTYSGSHAEYVLLMDSWCVHKPKNVSHVEAASFPYSSCTAWAALVTTARIQPCNPGDVRVLIHGGAGGVGTLATQFLKIWGVPVVVATCSPDSFDLVKSLGAIPVDYNDAMARGELIEHGPYDVILDCAESELAEWSDNTMGIWRNSCHVSVISPLLRDTDRFGLFPGLVSTAAKYARRSAVPAANGRWFSYAFFSPNSECLGEVQKYVSDGRMKPIIERTYSFQELPAAYEKVYERHGRGKTVIDFDKIGGAGFGEAATEIPVKKAKDIEVPTPAITDTLSGIAPKTDTVVPTSKVYDKTRAKSKLEEEVEKVDENGEVFKPAPSEESHLKLDPVPPTDMKPKPDMPSPSEASPV